MNIICLFYKIRLYFHIKRLKKNLVLKGKGHNFSMASSIEFTDGSSSNDVILDDHVSMHGNLASQSHGKIYMGPYAKLGSGSEILSVKSIYIGAYTAIAKNVTICDNNNHPISPSFRKQMQMQPAWNDMRLWKHSRSKEIIIGDNVWIGQCARICKGVTIGNNSIVASNAVVTKDIPSNTIAAGNPAKIVKTIVEK